MFSVFTDIEHSFWSNWHCNKFQSLTQSALPLLVMTTWKRERVRAHARMGVCVSSWLSHTCKTHNCSTPHLPCKKNPYTCMRLCARVHAHTHTCQHMDTPLHHLSALPLHIKHEPSAKSSIQHCSILVETDYTPFRPHIFVLANVIIYMWPLEQ
jgi:hypothetical protein